MNVKFSQREGYLSTADPVIGPPVLITKGMVVKSICKIKNGKASGPSGVVSKMLKASSDISSGLIAGLTNSIVRENAMPSEWDDRFIFSLFKDKGKAIGRGNYRGLKLTEHMLTVVERITKVITRNNMKFGFMPGRSTTDTIFILRQIQEKFVVVTLHLLT